jgi:hypothetical protein
MTGIHPVKVAVDPSVATVEVFLNGESIGVVEGPDWTLQCDFGDSVRPHFLEAVGRDSSGAETGRAQQVVNLPRPEAEVEIVLEDGTHGAPETVRVITESGQRLEPLAVFVTFDGRSLLPEPDGRFRLPAYDHREMHLLGAEAHYPDGITARSDVTFGGAYGGVISSELTAVAVEVDGGRGVTVADLEGMLRVRGKTVSIAAVEQQGARVFFIRDRGAWPTLRRVGYSMDRITRRRNYMVTTDRDLPAKRDRLHLVVANPTHQRGLALFPFSDAFDIKRLGLPWLVAHLENEMGAATGQRLAEAVAVAGMRAVGGGSPRAVVLVLSRDTIDYSRYKPQSVRDYLRALRVPLVVWTTDGGGLTSDWGEASRVSTQGSLRKASRRLLKSLKRQWIVWIEGRHLPSDIELDERATRFRLAG